MDFSRILTLIDDELARLRSAREILSTLATAPPVIADILSSDAPQERLVPLAAAEEAPELSTIVVQASAPKPQASKPLERRARTRRPAKSLETVSRSSALQKPLSSQPVFVPAARILGRHAASQQPSVAPPHRDALTAEALSQRWLPPTAL